jgi:hypothetical protein
MRFEAINGVTENEVKTSQFFIYAHKCSKGIYVGMAEDPVRRWQEHVQDANNKHSHHYDEKFKIAIRQCGTAFQHYILDIAKFEKAARRKEAAAIEYYEANLNIKDEKVTGDHVYRFRPIDDQISVPVFLDKKGTTGSWVSQSDADRTLIVAEIVEEGGRKRVRCTHNQPFKAGLRVECDKEDTFRKTVIIWWLQKPRCYEKFLMIN